MFDTRRGKRLDPHIVSGHEGEKAPDPLEPKRWCGEGGRAAGEVGKRLLELPRAFAGGEAERGFQRGMQAVALRLGGDRRKLRRGKAVEHGALDRAPGLRVAPEPGFADPGERRGGGGRPVDCVATRHAHCSASVCLGSVTERSRVGHLGGVEAENDGFSRRIADTERHRHLRS
jgi:hypothetical protein